MTELKLEVGKTYLDRCGNHVYIESENQNRSFPFLSSDGLTYRSNGRELTSGTYACNLISEYVELTPAAPARTPHKWAAEMHAFADGYEIQTSWNSIDWRDVLAPQWHSDCFYRIKPEPVPLQPNKVAFVAILTGGLGCSVWDSETQYNFTGGKAVRIEFNPNDQTLVSAEVVTL